MNALQYLHIFAARPILLTLAALPGAQVALHAVAAFAVGHDFAQGGCRLGVLAGAALEDGGGGVLRTGVRRGRADAALCIWLPHALLHQVTNLQYPATDTVFPLS